MIIMNMLGDFDFKGTICVYNLNLLFVEIGVTIIKNRGIGYHLKYR